MAPLVLHVAGARPNLPKLAPVLRALGGYPIQQKIVHTGQHYDDRLSGIFFRELEIPAPDINLGVGAGSQGEQTGAMIAGLERVLTEQQPALVVVYGDVNSTLAAALAAVKLGIDVAHVESGLRSFDRSMPEEVNRLVVDRLATMLLTTSEDAAENLRREGIPDGQIHFVGNPMIDTLLTYLPRVERTRPPVPNVAEHYLVATLHRPGNVDQPEDATQLARLISRAAVHADVVMPLHPRGRRKLARLLGDNPRVHLTEPLGYLDFLALIRGAAAVLTDSGGVQEETTVLGVPCLTLRSTTERPVTIESGTNRLVDRADLLDQLATTLAAGRPRNWPVPPLWDGKAGPRIAKLVAARLLG